MVQSRSPTTKLLEIQSFHCEGGEKHLDNALSTKVLGSQSDINDHASNAHPVAKLLSML